MADDNHWRTPSFRQSVVAKIDEAVTCSGMPTIKNSIEMENHVFQKAKTKEEYLAFVARLILHVREMKTKPGGRAGPGVPGQMMQDPINALQNLARQGTGNNQMMGMQQGGMPPQGMNPGGMPQQGMPPGGMNPGGMNPGGMPQQGMAPGGMNPGGMPPQGINSGLPQGMNPGMSPNDMGGMVRQPTPQNTASNLLQSLNQRPPPGQMIGLQGMQNKMGGMGMNPGQQGGPMGQMPPGQQMQAMNMNPMGIAMGGQMIGHMQQRKPGEMMMGQQGGPFMGPRGNAPPNQFLRQSPSPSAQSPAGMTSQMAASPALVPSPGSTLGGAMTPRSNSMSGIVQSPGSALNTPQQASPGNVVEEQQYREKVRQLSRYIEPLRRMIARMGNDDVDKLSKMKTLLEILSNPSKRMPLDTLRKCEVVLEKMDLRKTDGGSVGPYSGHMTGTKEMGFLSPLLEAVNNCLQSSVNNHTLQRTFGPTLETMFGNEIKMIPARFDLNNVEEVKSDVPEVLQGEIARLDQRFKVSLDGTHLPGSASIRLICWLDDKHLPAVPPVSVSVPADYPKHPPRCNIPQQEYSSTEFLSSVHKALTLRIHKLPSRFSLSQLLDAWEMSVRQACALPKCSG